MSFVIIPNSLSAAINAKLDSALAGLPDAEASRDHLFHELLDYYNEHGIIPDFSVTKRTDAQREESDAE